jgi:hypothetical protein
MRIKSAVYNCKVAGYTSDFTIVNPRCYITIH